MWNNKNKCKREIHSNKYKHGLRNLSNERTRLHAKTHARVLRSAKNYFFSSSFPQAYLKHIIFSQPYVYAYRDLISTFTTPTPSEIPGSNIRSRETEMGGVKVRLYEPIESREPGLRPAFIFAHGGGFCIGTTGKTNHSLSGVKDAL